MMRTLVMLSILVFLVPGLRAQDVEIFGYFEPQFTGVYLTGEFFQFNSNKLRIDLEYGEVRNVKFGANFLTLLYFGQTRWNTLDFFLESVTQDVPPNFRPYYEYAYRDTIILDNVYVRISGRRLALTAGKQQISLGTGYFSNPTDVFNIKDAIDPTYEQPGHNGIRLDWMLARRLQLLALYAPIEEHWDRSGKLLRLKVGIGHFDISALGVEIPYRRTDFDTFEVEEQTRRILGGDAVGELLGLGVWAEGSYSFLEDGEEFYEFLIGADYTFESGLYGLLEYHHNSLGKGTDEELDLNAWMRFFTGEIKTIARDQIYGFIQYPVTDLIALGSSFIYSVSDGSIALVPTAYWSLFENVELTLIVNLFVGEEGKVYSSTLGNGGFLRARVYF